MVSYLERQGIVASRKRVKRLMENMGLEALAPKPKTSIPSKENNVYPYLLRGLEITRQDQVWCSDITNLPVRHGYLFHCAVMDWHSRFVILLRLSNNMDTTFVIEILEEALGKGAFPFCVVRFPGFSLLVRAWKIRLQICNSLAVESKSNPLHSAFGTLLAFELAVHPIDRSRPRLEVEA